MTTSERFAIKRLSRWLPAALLMLPCSVGASDLDVVIDRTQGSIELFIGTKGENFERIFGLPRNQLADSNGLVDFAPLREGTWDIAQSLLSRTSASLDGMAIDFEAMSLMVHPEEGLLPPMVTPLDAALAMSVCTVDDPKSPPSLEDLQGHAGYIAYVDDSDAALSIHLPETGRESLTVAVRDFDNGTMISEFVSTIADGGTIEIPRQRQNLPATGWFIIAFGGIFAGVMMMRTPYAKAHAAKLQTARK